jgi:hypothetical protein
VREARDVEVLWRHVLAFASIRPGLVVAYGSNR